MALNNGNVFIDDEGGSSTSSSCKYATLTDKCLGSPQDLSLNTSASMTPHGVSRPSDAAPSAVSSAPASSSTTSSSTKANKSSASTQRHSSSKNSSSQQHPAASSPSSVSSVSSGSQSDPQSPGHDGTSGSKNANAPQIYPWMKRVHLGQSKYRRLLVYTRLLDSVVRNARYVHTCYLMLFVYRDVNVIKFICVARSFPK